MYMVWGEQGIRSTPRARLSALVLAVSRFIEKKETKKKNNLERAIQEINEVQLFQQANVFSWTVVHMLNCVMKEGANYF